MPCVSTEKLSSLQHNPSNVRNICILAHVDHGKTTLADSLVASNGIISQRLAGKLKYLDSRKDEQERGITMKSSAIALTHVSQDEQEYLINLIDSPGHVDFSSEVSTAVRICDGAIVLVDVVEGVCAQTKICLKQAWIEGIKPVLVINKIDRLILEMKFTPLDAYVHLTQILEQVNAVTAELFSVDVMGRVDSNKSEEKVERGDADQVYDWNLGLDEMDDSHLYFSPDQGNVAFASAVDGWGFRVTDFASLYSTKLKLNRSVLEKTLWGDFYFNSKSKRVMRGAQEKAKKPLFVQLVLENIWAAYDAIVVRKDRIAMEKIVSSLGLNVSQRDMRHSDHRLQLQAVFSQWLPLSSTILEMVCHKLPNPMGMIEERAEKLMCSQMRRFNSLPAETQNLRDAFVACSSAADAPLIVFISKMFPVDKASLPQNKMQPLTTEELARRRAVARQRHAERLAQSAAEKESGEEMTEAQVEELKKSEEAKKDEESSKEEEDMTQFVAFARVFSGTIRKGQKLYVLGPKHEPESALEQMKSGIEIDPTLTLKDLKSTQHITMVEVSHLYLLMGRELESLEEVPAGNVLGIGGLEHHVLKSATLSSTVACPAFTELNLMAVPILRVAVEPAHTTDMHKLVRGLKLLNQSDACVQVYVQETGEHVLVTAGEVHLQRCLDDLKQSFAKIEINVSKPIVPFRETVVPVPKMDMVNEAIEDTNQLIEKSDPDADPSGTVEIRTPNKRSVIRIRAVPLPPAVTAILEKNPDLLRAMDREVSSSDCPHLSEKTIESLKTLQTELDSAFDEAGDEWHEASHRIWSVGPRRCGPNILLNRISGYNRPSVWDPHLKKASSPLSDFDSNFVNGFQMATLAGPLCEEPMMGICFVVETWRISDSADEKDAAGEGSQPYGPFSGQIMSVVKEACRKAFLAQPPRLMMAMYSCSIQVNSEMLGKMYAVLGRRHGRVLHGDMEEGSSSFSVTAVLPVVESFNFANEIRRQTSGLASPQLLFSHWEVLDIDPFWVPRTEEEYLLYGEKADSENRAKKYMDAVRRRKGLHVQDKIVEFAEKQRTLTRNK